MPRYKLTLEYDGMRFYGWQRQEGVLSVQEAIETALLKLNGTFVLVEGAGRTDKGVHALGQVAHIDLEKEWEPFKLKEGLNHFLRHISILNIEKVMPPFHARFSAKERRYCYRIVNRPAPLSLDHERAWHVRKHLDVEKMQEAASDLVGYHDFSAFRASECQAKSPVRTLLKAEIKRFEEHIQIYFHAPSFLHNQVRIMVGTLKKIGEDVFPVSKIQEGLLLKDRTKMGPTAPPHGLYLTHVFY
jgi:tRNA pseudouridine38-40 synthase